MFPQIILFGTVWPTYFLWISLTFSLCLWLFLLRTKFAKKGILDLSLILMGSGLFGARLFHVIYEEPAYYWENPLRVFEVWNGGHVFFGGFLTAWLIGNLSWTWIRRSSSQKMSRGQIHDELAPIVSFGAMLGRIGCLLAGCCYGRTCDLPWAIAGRHPTALYSIFWELGVFLILLGSEKKLLTRPGKLFWLWLALHSIGRFFIEFFRDDFRGPQLALSVSGWISCILFIIAILGFRKKP